MSIYLTDSQLDELAEKQFIVIDDFLAKDDYDALRVEATQQDYRDAQIANGLEQSIRSDGIAWIEKESSEEGKLQPQGNAFVAVLEELGNQLNRCFFTGIQRAEAHYACYGAGKFYKRHVDNPKGSDNRVFSCVFYMNEDWSLDNGGELIMYQKKHQHSVLPYGNRIVIFDSNIPHEVKPNNKRRYSIACWLRRDC